MTREASRYLHKVYSLLPVPHAEKKGILAPLQNNVEVFLEELPTANYSDFCSRFGDPETIADSAVSEHSACSLRHRMDLRNKLLRLAIMIAVIIAVGWIGVVAASYIDARNMNRGYGITDPVQYLPSETTIIDETSNTPG